MSGTNADKGPSNRQGIIVIPARLESSRLPKKLLLSETGRPLLAHVVEQARLAVDLSNEILSEVIVACDRPELAAVADACGVRFTMTQSTHRNGTTRIAEAVQDLSLQDVGGFVVNVQADQPDISPNAIVRLAEAYVFDDSADMATLAIAMGGEESENLWQNPNIVKVAIDSSNLATRFSRSPIPPDCNNGNDAQEAGWYRHVGVYAYRLTTLREIAQLPPSKLEVRENLEQLRALEAGKAIRVLLTTDHDSPHGVDTPDDYRRFVDRWYRQCRTC